MCKEIYLTLQHRFQFLWCMDMEGGRTPQKTEGRYHTDESETMVAMQVGDEDMA
jgi:hypothetical protein